MTEPIAPTSELGTGLVLPIAKALTHLMAVHTAIDREWPLSASDAIAEIQDARDHIRAANVPEHLMTAEAVTTLAGWRAILEDRITTSPAASEDTPLADVISIAQLHDLAASTWQLLSLLDRELTGLSPTGTDPGRLP